MKVRLNIFFNALLDVNMGNGFNRPLENAEFEKILD